MLSHLSQRCYCSLLFSPPIATAASAAPQITHTHASSVRFPGSPLPCPMLRWPPHRACCTRAPFTLVAPDHSSSQLPSSRTKGWPPRRRPFSLELVRVRDHVGEHVVEDVSRALGRQRNRTAPERSEDLRG